MESVNKRTASYGNARDTPGFADDCAGIHGATKHGEH